MSSRTLPASVALAAAFSVLGAGCARTHDIVVPVSQVDVRSMQKRLNGKEVTVQYVERDPATPGGTGDRPSLAHGTAHIDLSSIRTVDGGNERSVPLTQVRVIEHLDYDQGTGHGMAIGIGAGALLGGATGFMIGCPEQRAFCPDRTTTTATLALTGALAGTLAGLLAGRSSGAMNYWVLRPADQRVAGR
jgi:hypothetical protein